MTKAGANQPSVPRQLSRRATSEPVRLEQFAGRGDRRPDIKDARPQTGNLMSPTSETGAKQHRAGTGFAASGRAADGYHEPHPLAARNDPTHGHVPRPVSLPACLTPAALLEG